MILLFVAPLLSAQQSKVASGQLWSWFANCAEKKYMGLEITQNRKVIYRSSFPVCAIVDRSEEVEKRLVFSFKGDHVFQGEYHTTATQSVEGNIWQAGTDPGVIVFGISFSTKEQVLLNTTHVAKADKASMSEIDSGITVRTFPISRKRTE
jgi:hypothetical protein